MKILKFSLLGIANYIIILPAMLFYSSGYIGYAILLQLTFAFLNYMLTTKKWGMLLLDLNLLIATIIANKFAYILYSMNNITDVESLAVIKTELFLGLPSVLMLTIVSLMLKKEKHE